VPESERPRLTLETDRLVLRELRPGEEQRLQRVLERCADLFPALAGRPVAPAAAAAEELRAAAAAEGRTVAVLVLGETGGDVGALAWWARHPAPDRALLGMLAVDPDHRGRGLAREALTALEAWLAARGVAALRTAFPRRRLALHPLARALGFRELGIAEHTALGLAGAGISLWETPVAR
jgi:GNAT superfamily N-acetyltransferase